jgi:hypothetical protein
MEWQARIWRRIEVNSIIASILKLKKKLPLGSGAGSRFAFETHRKEKHWAKYVLIANNFLKQVFRYSQFDMAGNKNMVEENVKFGPLLLESASLGNLHN